jgi:DNA-binding NarL/FixJ family response regulator
MEDDMHAETARGARVNIHHIPDRPQGEPRKSRVGSAARSNAHLVIINRNVLGRDCLIRALSEDFPKVSAFESVDAFLAAVEVASQSAMALVCIGSRRLDDKALRADLQRLNAEGVKFAVMADQEHSDQVMEALAAGARGYIPTNLSLDVAIEAMQFVRAGGIFVPASSIMSGHNRPGDGSLPGAKERFGGIFTSRQAAVVKALREGKANKRIAHELDMRESTVKVHVRNIMRKLNARNRTEVAYRTNGMFENDES